MVFKPVFDSAEEGQIWLEDSFSSADSNILVTVTSIGGKKSKLISKQGLSNISETHLVDSAPEPKTDVTPRQHLAAKKIMNFTGYALAILLLIFAGLSFTGNAKARIVLTGSMSPAISVGDVIVTVPITQKEPQIGDVIAYQAKRFNGENVAVFSHRIIDGDIENGFVMKGDANKSPDPQKPKAADILGVVLFTIPFIGNLLTPKALFLLIPCLFGLWLIMDAMKNVE